MEEVVKEIAKEVVNKYIDKKQKPYISVIVEFCSGLICILCVLTLLAPFSISVVFLDKINWKMDLHESSSILSFALGAIAMQLAYCVITKVVMRKYHTNKNKDLLRVYTPLFTIGDIVDTIASLFIFVFMLAVFLQLYHTGIMYIGGKALLVYCWIAARAILLPYRYYYSRNQLLLKKVLDDHPEFD